MRNLKQLITDIATKQPIIFPLVGLAHVVWLLYTIWSDRYAPFGGLEWLGALWMLGYTICWLAACDLRKWGALGYILLTMVNVGIYLTARSLYARDVYMSNLFIIDGMFSVLLLVYFKRFNKQKEPKDTPII